MKLPWHRRTSDGHLAVAEDADRFAYAEADAGGRLRRCGVELRGDASPGEFARRLRGLGLPADGVCAVLPLARGQLVQIEAPAVRPEELRAAARWQIKDLVEGRLDELAIDVLHVGGDRPRPKPQLFVAAAPNAAVRETGERLRAAGLELAVVDLAEMAQRNLQSAQARVEGLGGRATAALVRHGSQCLLTICADDELFHARRLDWQDPRDLGPPDGAAIAAADLDTPDFVDYSIEPDPVVLDGRRLPPLVTELQRSLDLWERSWPQLPLAAVWLQVGDASAELAELLARLLDPPVGLLDPGRVFPGYQALCQSPIPAQDLLLVLGELLRSPPRQA